MKGKDRQDRMEPPFFRLIHLSPYSWGVMTVFIAVFAIMIRPVAWEAVDYWNERGMTNADRRDSMGLPFPVSKPPVGVSHILNRDQLRWIFLQEIRMDAMRTRLNHDNEEAVKKFIRMVDDYNSRAASYQCESADLQAARQDVEQYREAIRESAVAEAEAMGWDKPAEGS